jgi:hypothetical protein
LLYLAWKSKTKDALSDNAKATLHAALPVLEVESRILFFAGKGKGLRSPTAVGEDPRKEVNGLRTGRILSIDT